LCARCPPRRGAPIRDRALPHRASLGQQQGGQSRRAGRHANEERGAQHRVRWRRFYASSPPRGWRFVDQVGHVDIERAGSRPGPSMPSIASSKAWSRRSMH
jgi:hypothetical protein